MIRNTHKIGDWLVVDDESGLTHYASDMRRDWDGQMRHKDNLDGRHPQLDVAKAVRRDPQPLRDIRERAPSGLPDGEILAEESDEGQGASVIFIAAEDGITILSQES